MSYEYTPAAASRHEKEMKNESGAWAIGRPERTHSSHSTAVSKQHSLEEYHIPRKDFEQYPAEQQETNHLRHTDEDTNNNMSRHYQMRVDVPRAGSVPVKEDDDIANETLYFERNRIKQLQDERVVVQKKTFTKWCNSFLNRARLEIVDLFVDIGDGVLLMKLLEIISGEKLGKPNRGRMRVQKVENLNKSLDFLKRKKIQLENIGAEDILDRNERLILGLIWTIILRFQIDTIVIHVDEQETGERKHAKDALLLWCQRKTAGYSHVKIENFTSSWRSGLAFNALIHSHRPDLINYDSLNPSDHLGNLNNAFDVAEKRLEIARLLDAEDVDAARPDEKSIITYVSLYYHHFAKHKTEMTGARRVANIMGKIMSQEGMEDDFECISSDLLTWINTTIKTLNARRFPNSLKGIQDELTAFSQFRTGEKPPKYKEKGELEALFFTIQTKRKAMGRPPYVPPNGLYMHDIETAWNRLDKAENDRQAAIIAELQRQERLLQLANKFHRKAALRETWLREMHHVLERLEPGCSASDVEKSLKKQQAIATDVLAREDRFKSLVTMSGDLQKENYCDADKVRAREREIMERWQNLLALLEQRRKALMSLNDLMTLLRDMDTLSSELKHQEPIVRNRDVGKHILGVDDLLEKHKIVEKEVNAQGTWLSNVTRQGHAYIRNKGEQYEVLQRKLDDVTQQYDSLVDLCRQRRLALTKARELFQFIQDDEEENNWIREKTEVCRAALASSSRDISQVPQINRLHKNVETEMQSHWARSKEVMAAGERLVQAGQAKEEITRRIHTMQANWETLRKEVAALGQWLAEAQHAQHYFQDANEAESWIREKMPLVKSDDLGKEEAQAESLLQRHTRLEEEIIAYRADIVRLEDMSTQLANSNFHTATASTVEETEEVVVQQVRMAYKYEGNGMKVDKDEILALLEKSTDDWWRVLKQDGCEGYVPANYCKVVDGETVTVSQSTGAKKRDPVAAANGKKAIVERQQMISGDYRKLISLAEVRRRLLSDNIKLMRFYRDCDEFEMWARDTEHALMEEPSAENVEVFRKKFNRLEADMASNGGLQLQRINITADELIAEGHSQTRHIEGRASKVNTLWDALESLRKEKSRRLDTAERIAAFDASCEDARLWMKSKFDQLDRNPSDLKSLQNLERDLKPLENKMLMLEELARHVMTEHPEQAGAIEHKIRELRAIYEDLRSKAQQKIRLAEQSQGQEMFETALRDMLVWTEKTGKQLQEPARAVDVSSAEELLKKHGELGEMIKDKKYEQDYVEELGRRLLDKNPHLQQVTEQLAQLDGEMLRVRDAWRDKNMWLNEQLELQLFNREAERIDTASKGHETFLDFADLGNSVESVEGLLKRHRDFEAKLEAQESRLEAFSRNADKLAANRHGDAHFIDERRTEVLARRASVRRMAADRRRRLEAALEYQSLRRDGDELLDWVAEKKKLTVDDAHLELATIGIKLLKHEAFEAEIGANAPRVERVNREGAALIHSAHHESASVERLVERVNREWAELRDAAARKGEKLRQASEQKGLNQVLDDAHHKLDELEGALRSEEMGADLRGVKDLIQKHTVLETEMQLHERRLVEIEKRARAMAEQGHFDAPRIQATVADLLKRFSSLSHPAEVRRAKLDESRMWHQLAFDVDCELQWIAEKEPIAASMDTGRTLTEALNMLKKQEQLEAEVQQHAPHIEHTVQGGQQLINNRHYASKHIQEKCDELVSAWSHLNKLVKQRQTIVNWGVKELQYMFDAAEVESWMAEKRAALESDDYGSDEDAAQKLLAKHRALQNDMSTYRQWLDKLGLQCDELLKSGRPHTERFQQRQKELEREFARLSQLAEERRRALDDAVCLYEYLRESHDLEQWINEQLQTAMSEEYGDDYEHLQELQSRFDEFKQSVKTGSERFVSCEQAASSILSRSPPFANQILIRQEKLRSVWTLLMDYIESRENKLQAAEELHRFNRDVAEHEETVYEKLNTMPTDLGRDVKQVHSLWLKHETFEKQLGSMEQNLKKLLAESARLIEEYPGANAKLIATQQASLSNSWQVLGDATAVRGDQLRAAYDVHRLAADARDLLTWAEMQVADMQSEPAMHDLQGAEWQQKEHARLWAEIEARRPEFERLRQTGEKMLAGGHYAETEIRNKMKLVEDARDRLEKEWQLRNSYLAQVVQWHALQREAKQILAAIAARRSTLKGLAVGGNEQEVEAQQKRLDTFSKALSTLDERTEALDRTAAQLVAERHMESANIEQWRGKVHDALAVLRDELTERRRELERAAHTAAFHGDCADVDSWIDERLHAIRLEQERQGQCSSIEDKMARLQKHQATEAELAANKERVDSILVRGRQLQRGAGGEAVAHKCQNLGTRWQQLVSACDDQSRALEEARDLLQFTQLVERVMRWVKEKELMVAAGEMGNDLEHCGLLLERVQGTQADWSVDESTLQEINRLGEKLVQAGRSSRSEVQEQQAMLNDTWQRLQGRLHEYKRQLLAAKEVHAFNRDVDDTDERIHEKIAGMRSEDAGKDFASVDSLLRKHRAQEHDMGAIHHKLQQHDDDAQRLLAANPPLRHTMIDSLKKLEESWKELSEAAEKRSEALTRSHQLHSWLEAVRRAEQWAGGQRNRLSSHAPPKTSDEARRLIEQHNERKTEMDARTDELRELHEVGLQLIGTQPEHKTEVQRANKRVQNGEHQLRQAWDSEKANLLRQLDWLLFCEQAGATETWLAGKEAQLYSNDLGDGPDSVMIFIQKHAAFEETLSAQREKVQQLARAADQLAEKDSHYREDILQKRDAVLTREQQLLAACAARGSALTSAQRLHDFLRTCGELITWINAKLQLAYDESYLDPTNLRSKLQKHLAFDSELTENENRLEAVVAKGERLMREDATSKEQVVAQLAELRGGWDELRSKSALKTRRLRDAYEAHLLQRKCEDMERWLDKMETELESEDHGKDLLSVEALVKKLDAQHAEIAGRGEAVSELVGKARQLRTQGLAASESMLSHAEDVQLRYSALAEPVNIRSENLRDAKKLYEWLGMAEDELEWQTDRAAAATSVDCGDSLHAAVAFSNKHSALEKELESRLLAVHEVEQKGQEMISDKHFAISHIEETMDKLASGLLSMRHAVEARRKRLDEAVESHHYYAAVSEAEQWIRDQMPLAANQECGRDQAAAESQLRRLALLERDVEKSGEEVARLRIQADKLINKDHHDSTQIGARQRRVETAYADLRAECARRRQQLADASRYHAFVRQADDLADWLTEKEKAVACEDCGRDLEDCQQLSDALDTVLRELSAAGEKVHAVQRSSDELLRTQHPFSASISAKWGDVQHKWAAVNSAANERQQELAGARQVHRFDQEADETLCWLQDKEAMGVALESEDLSCADMALVNTQSQRLDEFLHGLKAVEKQVTELCREAERLETLFPNTRQHLEVRKMDMEEQLKDIVNGAKRHGERLRQTEHLQAYFQEHRELLAWIKRLHSTICSETLPQQVPECDALAQRHTEYAVEMNGRRPAVDAFVHRGRELVSSGHMLSAEIESKVAQLERSYAMLQEAWQDRNELYETNADAQRWKAEADSVERWLLQKEPVLGEEWRHLDSVPAAEASVRDFNDFLVTLEAQGERCEHIKRLTLIEKNFSRLRKKESERMRVEEEASKRRVKTVEKGDMLSSRRQERERRKTQEISLLRPTEDLASQTLPRRGMDRRERSKTTAFAPGETGVPSAAGMQEPAVSGADSSALKKTPSFTTSRRATSVQKKSKWEDASSIDMRGYVDRKQELQSGAKRATIRSWKNYYTILCGQLLCFFKDEESLDANIAAAPPVNIYGAACEAFPEYVKKKHALKVTLADGAEYLLACSDQTQMLEWVAKIKFHAALSPSNQLKSYQPHAFNEASPTRYEQPSSAAPTISNRHSLLLDTPTPSTHTHSSNTHSLHHDNSTESNRGYLSLPRSSTMKTAPVLARRASLAHADRLEEARIQRRASRSSRSSVYESVYEHEEKEAEKEQEMDKDTGSERMERSSTISSREHTASVGSNMELNVNEEKKVVVMTRREEWTTTSSRLEYSEHAHSQYERQPSTGSTATLDREKVKNGDEFIAWVERENSHSPGTTTDDEQRGNKKKGFGSLFKRGSKSK